MSQPPSTFDDSEALPDESGAGSPTDTAPASPPPEDRYEGAVPPGYDWPTHGGYLGCLLGVMLSCIVGGFLASLVDVFDFEHHIRGLPNVLLVVVTFLAALALLGRVGWLLGRRFYREYAAKPTWGESDAYRPDWQAPASGSAEDEGVGAPTVAEPEDSGPA